MKKEIYILKITEKKDTEEEQESYLYSSEGIITFKDKDKATKKAQSLTSFFNGNRNKKNGNLVTPEELKGKSNSKQSFRWIIQSSFLQ